jgi:hypothetical protein
MKLIMALSQNEKVMKGKPHGLSSHHLLQIAMASKLWSAVTRHRFSILSKSCDKSQHSIFGFTH